MTFLRRLARAAGAWALILLASPGEAATPSVTASDGNNGRLSYTVSGVTSSKSITRQLF